MVPLKLVKCVPAYRVVPGSVVYDFSSRLVQIRYRKASHKADGRRGRLGVSVEVGLPWHFN